MAKNLSFAVALNLITSGFTKGANKANTALKSIQLQVRNLSMAFAAGAIGIGSFTSQVLQSIKGMSKAQQTLKNVTGDSYTYATSLKFVYDTSKKYNQELVSLTGNYAKFFAAARGSNINLRDTQNIFDALTQSSAYFNLSADETSGVMLAVTQMMSKGRITAEELRGQLGERLPGAIGIMARAINVSTAELDDLMKKGKLAAKEVLPLFAQQLKIETMNFNPNSIEGSINKLRNTISDLFATERMQKIMADIINSITSAFEVVANNIKTIWAGVLGTIAALTANRIKSIFVAFNNKVKDQVLEYERLNNKFAALNSKAGVLRIVDTGTLESKLARLKKKAYEHKLPDHKDVPSIVASVKETNKLKREIEKLEKYYNRLNRTANSNIEGIVKQEAATNKLSKGWERVNTSFSNFGASIKSFFASNWITLLIAGLTIAFVKINQMVNEWKRVNNIVKDTTKSINDAGIAFSKGGAEYTKEQSRLEYIRNLWYENSKDIEKRRSLLEIIGESTEKIKGYTAEQLSNDSLINKAIEDRLKLIKEEALLRARSQEYSRLLGEKDRVDSEIQKIGRKYSTGTVTPLESFKLRQLKKELNQINTALNDQELLLKKANDEIERRKTAELLNFIAGNKTEEDITTLEKYAKERKELENQLRNGAVSQKEYYEGVLKLTDSFIKQIGILDRLEGKYKELFYSLMQENLILQDFEIEIKDPELKFDTDGFFDKLKKSTSKDLYIPTRPDKRDRTFDYKKSDMDILEEEYKLASKLKEELQKAVDSGFSNYQIELDVAIKNETDLGKALKLAEVQDDIRKFNEEFKNGTYDTIKDVASAADRLVNAFRNMNEVLADTDASGFEKVMAIINALIQTVDSIMSVTKAIEATIELTKKLTAAKQAEAIITSQAAAQKVASTGVSMAAEVAGAATTVATTTTEVAANTASAASSAAADTAKIPFGWLAIPAVIAGVLGMMSAIPKFANGGIVSGATLGMMGEYAGASSNPEVIAPLSKLKNLLKVDEKPSSGEVKFTIKGQDLVGVINNYSKKTTKIK